MVVLDTDHMSLLERSGAQGSATLRARLATLQPAEVVTTIISYEEQVRGWMAYICPHSFHHPAGRRVPSIAPAIG